MPTEHGDAQLGGLRREHLVAAAMVAAVTVVLGFASGFGVLPGAAVAAPVSPAAPVTGQPGGQQVAPPAAGPLPPGVRRPGGTQVGIRPGSQGTSGAGTGSASSVGPGSSVGSGSGSDSDFGSFPSNPPESGSAPATPPTGSVVAPPQCPPGVLDQLLALIAQVLGGAEPAQALSASGAVTYTSLLPDSVDPGATVNPGVTELVTVLPIGDGWTVAVIGLVPLLDTINQRDDARRSAATALAAQPAAAPIAAEAPLVAPGDQLTQLAALLSPLGIGVDPASGSTDPLLAPVLGSLGCTGFVAVPAPAAPAAPAGSPQAAIR
ncbi:MAG: hypothetical protein ACT4NY_06045 [Pseudonocardiales bacterium]